MNFQKNLRDNFISVKNTLISIDENYPILTILLAIIVGASTGFLGSLFQICISQIIELRENLNHQTQLNPSLKYISIFVLTATMGYFAYYLVRRYAPESSGSGIPEIEGALLDLRPVRWWRVLPVKFFGGLLSLGSGMVLGREGPTVQMGANLGKMTADTLQLQQKNLQHSLVATGAGAGITAAFNAPLGGILFVIEEMHSEFKYSKSSIIAIIVGCISSCIVYQAMISPLPILNIGGYTTIPLETLWIYILLGLSIGIFGSLSNYLILKIRIILDRLYKKKSYYFMLTGSLLAGIFGVLSIHHKEFTGGGFDLIPNIANGFYPFLPLFFILLIRLIATVLCFGSGAPGGVFSPTLALGSILGVLFGLGMQFILPGINISLINCAILGMAAMFAATIRAPLTGIVIVIEMTGSYTLLLPLLITCIFAAFMAQLLGARPLYTAILENTLIKAGLKLPKEN